MKCFTGVGNWDRYVRLIHAKMYASVILMHANALLFYWHNYSFFVLKL